MGENLRVGVAGIGFIGPAHIEGLRRLPDVDVISIAHHRKETLQTKAEQLGIKKFYQDFDEMIHSDGLDCVHICTPNVLHFDMAKKALNAGLHVVCEKPLATTIEEARELVKLASDKDVVNAVHFNIRYYPVVREMKRMREKGILGGIYSVIGSYLQDWLFLATDYNWRLEKAQSGDSRAIADIGSHLLDLIEYISGLRVTQVMADFNTVHSTRKKPLKPIETYSGLQLNPDDYEDVPIETEDYASVLLRFDNGSKGVVTVSQVAAGRKNQLKVEISGSKQNMAWNSESPNELWIGHRNEPNKLLMRDPALFDSESAGIISFPGGHNEGFPDTSKQLFKEVYAAIKNPDLRIDPAYPTFEDGLRELILCEKILESNREQKWIEIPSH